MSARPKARPTRKHTTTTSTTTATPPTTLPPVVAALAALFDVGEGGRIDDDFLAAWTMAPAIIAQAMSGDGGSDTGTTRFDLIDRRLAEAVTRGKSSEWSHENIMASVIQALEETNPDALSDIRSTIGEAGFLPVRVRPVSAHERGPAGD